MGLDPAIHLERCCKQESRMGARVRPAHDDGQIIPGVTQRSCSDSGLYMSGFGMLFHGDFFTGFFAGDGGFVPRPVAAAQLFDGTRVFRTARITRLTALSWTTVPL